MMEESSDESAEIITKEEADLARKMQDSEISSSGNSTPDVPTAQISNIAPPAPLPAFMNVSSSSEKEGTPASIPQKPTPGSAVPTSVSTPSVPTPVSAPSVPKPVTAPDPIETPHEASSQIEVPEMVPDSPQSHTGHDSGLFGWISGNKLMSKVKSSMETMITTLDPGMKEIIKSGGDVEVIVTSVKENKVGAVREAFQHVFGKATVSGVESQSTTAAQPVGFTAGFKGAEERIQNLRQQSNIAEDIPMVSLEGFIIETIPDRVDKVGAVREAFQHVFGKATISGVESQSTTAAQPVGFTAGFKGAEERIQNLRQQGNIAEDIPMVSLEGFIIETIPDRWFEMTCLILRDPTHRIELQTFSQPTPIPTEYVLKAQDSTPSDYPLRWSGLSKSIGQAIEETHPHIGHTDWQLALTGVSRRESLCLAAKTLAFMYKERLPSSFVS